MGRSVRGAAIGAPMLARRSSGETHRENEERMLKTQMRRASTHRVLAPLGAAALVTALALPASALATPKATVHARPIPIPGVPHSGNFFNAPSGLELQVSFEGTEFTGGVPAPLTEVKTWLPKGAKVHEKGFVSCPPSKLERGGPHACPKKSQASPVGKTHVVDVIAGEPVYENGTVQGFFAPGGGLEFWAESPSPVKAELVVSTAHSHKTSEGPFGLMYTSPVKLVESVPGAPPVTTLSFTLKIGGAYKKHGKWISYGTTPASCPLGHWPFKAEFSFLDNGSTTVETTAPCPKGGKKHGKKKKH
jgi:hypothetical protein